MKISVYLIGEKGLCDTPVQFVGLLVTDLSKPFHKIGLHPRSC